MLKRLKINNYALIDSIEISFDKGMTSITGETGAEVSTIFTILVTSSAGFPAASLTL